MKLIFASFASAELPKAPAPSTPYADTVYLPANSGRWIVYVHRPFLSSLISRAVISFGFVQLTSWNPFFGS